MEMTNSEFIQKYHNFSISMKQMVSHTLSILRTEKEAHHLLEMIIDAKTEQDLMDKLKNFITKEK